MRFWANGLVVLHICAPSEGALVATKCALLAAMLLFHSCSFTHSINQGWANLFNRSHLQETKNTSEQQKQFECKFYIK